MNDVLSDKSYKFALEIVTTYQNLANKKEYILSKQLLKSGTSIGANIREAKQAQSRNDFVAKLYISLKEANETGYWLQLLADSGYLDISSKNRLEEYLNQLIAITIKSIATAKSNQNT